MIILVNSGLSSKKRKRQPELNHRKKSKAFKRRLSLKSEEGESSDQEHDENDSSYDPDESSRQSFTRSSRKAEIVKPYKPRPKRFNTKEVPRSKPCPAQFKNGEPTLMKFL